MVTGIPWDEVNTCFISIEFCVGDGLQLFADDLACPPRPEDLKIKPIVQYSSHTTSSESKLAASSNTQHLRSFGVLLTTAHQQRRWRFHMVFQLIAIRTILYHSLTNLITPLQIHGSRRQLVRGSTSTSATRLENPPMINEIETISRYGRIPRTLQLHTLTWVFVGTGFTALLIVDAITGGALENAG